LPIIENLKKETSNKNLFFLHLDLNDLNSVLKFSKNFKDQFKSLDILINNAGVG